MALSGFSKRFLILCDYYINVSENTVYSYLVPVISDRVKWQSMDYISSTVSLELQLLSFYLIQTYISIFLDYTAFHIGAGLC